MWPEKLIKESIKLLDTTVYTSETWTLVKSETDWTNGRGKCWCQSMREEEEEGEGEGDRGMEKKNKPEAGSSV